MIEQSDARPVADVDTAIDPMNDMKMLGIEVPEVEDPDRFFPEPRLVRMPEIDEEGEDGPRIRIAGREGWQRVHPVLIDIIRGLALDQGFDAAVASIPDHPEDNIRYTRQKRSLARKFTWQLARAGCVEWPLPEQPDVFDGRYRRIKELGRGGLGIAWLCHDEQGDLGDVVIKHPWGVKSPIYKGQRTVALEAYMLEHHPHTSLPAFHGTFTDRGLIHLVREYVDGESLGSCLSRARADPAYRDHLFREVCGALDHVHRSGFVFFDPSPANFFVRPAGHITISDVGGVRPLQPDGRIPLRGARGTAGYVASEMRGPNKKGGSGRFATIRSDIYSLGCLYYAMVTGRRPKRLWHGEEIVADLRERGVDGGIVRLVEAATRADPARRPADVPALLALLPE